MNLNDLLENRLPLFKGQIPNARGDYGAFVCVMTPRDFLKLTATPEDLKRILADPFPDTEADYSSWKGNLTDYGRFPMPFLKVKFPSGKVFGHEGRHRAAMVMRQGGKAFPVMIYPYGEDRYEAMIRWIDDETDEDHRWSDIFDTEEEADDDVEQKWSEIGPNIYGKRTRVTVVPYGKLRGAPARSQPQNFEYAMWRVEDFPPCLFSQYNSYDRVCQFKVGLVKGYRHHRIK